MSSEKCYLDTCIFCLAEGPVGPEGDSGGPSRVFCAMALQKSWQGPCGGHKPSASQRVSPFFPPVSAFDQLWPGHVGKLNSGPVYLCFPQMKEKLYLKHRR